VRPPRVSRTTPSHGRRAVLDHQLASDPRTPGIARLHFALGSGITSAFRHSRRDSPRRIGGNQRSHCTTRETERERERETRVYTHTRARTRAHTAHIDPRRRRVAGEASVKVGDRGPSLPDRQWTEGLKGSTASSADARECERNFEHVLRSPSALERAAHLYATIDRYDAIVDR